MTLMGMAVKGLSHFAANGKLNSMLMSSTQLLFFIKIMSCKPMS